MVMRVQASCRPHLQVFGHLADGLKGVVSSGVGALVGVDEQGQPPVLLLDLA